MKRLFLIFLILFFTTNSYAERIKVKEGEPWTKIGTTVSLTTDSDNVDIGGNLTVDGDLYVGSQVTGNITINKADPTLILDTLTATDTDFWLGVQEDAGGTDDDKFQIGDGTTPGTNPFLTIDTSGYVGIGTTGPGDLLDIYGNTKNLQFSNPTGAGSQYINFFAGTTLAKKAQVGYNWSSGNLELNATDNSANRDIIFQTTNTTLQERMRITRSGSVGIGETAPAYQLELTDNTNTPTLGLSDDDIAHGVTTLTSTDTFAHLTSISTTVGGLQITGLADATGTALGLKGVQSSDPTDTTPAISLIGTKASGTGVQDLGATETVLQIANNDDTAAVTVLGSGYVGIGTTAPTNILTVKQPGGDNSGNWWLDAGTDFHLSHTGGYPSIKLAGTNARFTYGAGTSADNLWFSSRYAAGNTNNAVYFDSLGYVGIGTTAPGATLEIATTDAANATSLLINTEESTATTAILTVTTDATSADTTKLSVRADGDMVFSQLSSGLPYGSCYDTNLAFTQADMVDDQWYDISDADMNDGVLNLITHDGSGLLTVTEPGTYLISYNIAFEVGTANMHMETTISVSGTEGEPGAAHTETRALSTETNLAGTAIITLADNATINLSIRNTDNGTPDLTVEMINITMTMVGG